MLIVLVPFFSIFANNFATGSIAVGMMQIARGLGLVFSGAKPICFNDTPNYGRLLPESSISILIPGLEIPNGVMIMFIVAIISSIVLNRTIVGRMIFALGSNEEAARLSGISIDRWKILTHAVCAAIGLAAAIRESGAAIAGGGFDSGKSQKDAINDGTLIGSITQTPVSIGQCVVDSLVKALADEELPRVIDTGFYWYDRTNMADERIAAVLYD